MTCTPGWTSTCGRSPSASRRQHGGLLNIVARDGDNGVLVINVWETEEGRHAMAAEPEIQGCACCRRASRPELRGLRDHRRSARASGSPTTRSRSSSATSILAAREPRLRGSRASQTTEGRSRTRASRSPRSTARARRRRPSTSSPRSRSADRIPRSDRSRLRALGALALGGVPGPVPCDGDGYEMTSHSRTLSEVSACVVPRSRDVGLRKGCCGRSV